MHHFYMKWYRNCVILIGQLCVTTRQVTRTAEFLGSIQYDQVCRYSLRKFGNCIYITLEKSVCSNLGHSCSHMHLNPWLENCMYRVVYIYICCYDRALLPSIICLDRLRIPSKYNRTSMAWTSLGPWKFVRDMGSSSHWGYSWHQFRKQIAII